MDGSNETLVVTATTGPLPALAAALVVAVYVVVLAVNKSIVYYERISSDLRRTLVDRLTAAASAYNLLYASLFLPALAARLSTGTEFNCVFCGSVVVAGFAVMLQIILVHNATLRYATLLRYVYICRLRTVGVFNEDLVERLILCLNGCLGCFLSLSINALLGERNLLFTFCCGFEGSPVNSSNALVFIAIFTLTSVNHLALGFKILQRRRALKRAAEIRQDHRTNNSNSLLNSIDVKSSVLFLALMSAAALIYFGSPSRGRAAVAAIMAAVSANNLLVMPASLLWRRPKILRTVTRNIVDGFRR